MALDHPFKCTLRALYIPTLPVRSDWIRVHSSDWAAVASRHKACSQPAKSYAFETHRPCAPHSQGHRGPAITDGAAGGFPSAGTASEPRGAPRPALRAAAGVARCGWRDKPRVAWRAAASVQPASLNMLGVAAMELSSFAAMPLPPRCRRGNCGSGALPALLSRAAQPQPGLCGRAAAVAAAAAAELSIAARGARQWVQNIPGCSECRIYLDTTALNFIISYGNCLKSQCWPSPWHTAWLPLVGPSACFEPRRSCCAAAWVQRGVQ